MAIYRKIVFIAKVWLVLYYIKAKLSKALKQEDLRSFLHLKNPFAMHSNTWTKIFLNSYICNYLFFIGINLFVLWEFYSIEIILLRWGIWSMSLLKNYNFQCFYSKFNAEREGGGWVVMNFALSSPFPSDATNKFGQDHFDM